MRFEWVYNALGDITTVYLWVGMTIIDTADYKGEIDAYDRDGIEDELKGRYGATKK